MDEFEPRSKAEYESARKRFPYPLEIVSGADALSAFERIKATGAGTPVVIGNAGALAMTEEFMALSAAEHPSVDLILSRAAEINFPDTYRAMKARELELLRAKYPRSGEVAFDEPPVGEWPDEVSGTMGLTLAEDFEREPLDRVHIAILPTQDATAAPAYLRSGGWNQCPEAAVQVAALRSWRDRYGAELVGLGHDVMNIRVQRGPASRDEALMLAREHQLFCSDVMNDSTLTELGAYLMNDDWWFFWWD